jgi:glycosyltransferase 2 family protein
MKRLWQIGLSLGLTLLIGFIIYRGVPDWGHAWKVMIQGRPLLLLAGFGFVMLHMLLRALRWGVLLAPIKRKISIRNLFSLTLIKYVVNVIPPRVGEVVASVVLAKKENLSAASVIAASLLERIFDMLTVVIIFGVYLSFFAHLYAPNSERGEGIMLTIREYSLKGFIVLCLVFVTLSLILRSQKGMSRIPVKIRRFFVSFREGFRALQQGGALTRAVILSAAIWLSITMQLWCLVRAYLDDFPFLGALFLMAITVVGVAIPTPGGVGGFQFFMSLALVNFFSRYMSSQDLHSQAAGISNGSYIVSMVPIMIIGLILLNREGLSLGRITQMTDQDKGRSSQPSGEVVPR